MQAASDIFLGWDRVTGLDGRSHDYYCASCGTGRPPPASRRMIPALLNMYGQMCGWTLARAHARSGDRVAIASYLGSAATFDRADRRLRQPYADQNDLDHEALTQAIASGTMSTATRAMRP